MHLTYEERCQISALKANKVPQRKIAIHLKRDPSVISREIKRNAGGKGYSHKQAQKKSIERRGVIPKKRITPLQIEKVRTLMTEEQWSPEQITGRLKLEKISAPSHEWIYQYVWKDKRNGGSLYKNLRRRGKKYNKRSSALTGRGLIPNRVDIAERPEIVDQKTRLGDWEADTVIGKNHKGALLTIVERKTKLTFITKLSQKTSEATQHALCAALKPLQEHVHTITTDNGKEFAGHAKTAIILDAQCYFARPYRSWERGLNENTNGLIRQYVPKKFDLDLVSDKLVLEIQNRINSRPRKTLGFRSPIEVFNDLVNRLQTSVAFQT